jgi:glucose/arabinose dehydrogenase
MRHRAWILVLLCCLFAAPALAQLHTDVYVSGLSSPVAFVQDPSNPSVQFVVEQGGRVRAVASGVLQPRDFLDLSSLVSTQAEQGLLGLAFPPDYAASGRFYVNFTNVDGHTVVARFRRSSGDPLVADDSSRFDLRWPGGQAFIAQPFANHNGGNLVFGPDGYLYIGLGDGGSGDDPDHRAQNPGTLLGKMLRIDVSVPDGDAEGYDVPPTNPFVGVPGVLPEIWAFGLRNPWRYSFDDPRLGGTGALVIGDVGQNAWEEIDYEPAGRGGRNYGWRNREGAHDNITTQPPAFLPLTDPVFEYGRASGQAVTGGYVYRGARLGAFRGRYFFADYVASRVWSVALIVDPGTHEATAVDLRDHTTELGGSAFLNGISSFGVDAEGELYLVSRGAGRVLRVRAADSPPLMTIDAPAAGAVVRQPLLLGGWAFDPAATSGTGIDTLHVWAFPDPGSGAAPVFLGVASYGGIRPDVGAAYGAQAAPSAFGLIITGLAPGQYRLAVYGWVAAAGGFAIVRTVDVTIAASTQMVIDTPGQLWSVSSPFLVAGWAFDPSAPSGTGVDTVHVWAFPTTGGPPMFLGVPAYGASRPDVGAYYGGRFTATGYNLAVSSLPPGTYDIVVFSHSVVTASFDAAQVVRVTVR